VGNYDGMLKDQLRELCLKRGLNVSGTVAELTARLEGADAAQAQDSGEEPDLLAAAGLDQEPEQPPAPPPVTHPEPDRSLREPESTDTPANRTVHRVRFECPGDGVIPTEVHESFLRATEHDAINKGFAIRGHAQRLSFQHEAGMRYAVYEVTLGRPRGQAR
jgi:hypothetical protein